MSGDGDDGAMTSGAGASKRPLEIAQNKVEEVAPPPKTAKTEPPPPLSPSADVGATAAWLELALPDDAGKAFATTAKNQGVDAAALLSYSKEDLKSKLGGKIGPRAKLFEALERLRASRMTAAIAPTSNPGGNGNQEEDDVCMEGANENTNSGERRTPTRGGGGGSSGGGEEEGDITWADDANYEKALDLDEAAQEEINRESDALGRCKWVTAKLRRELEGPNKGWGTEAVRAQRLRELNAVESKLTLPTCSIVVVGNTGAGKSTLLNSLIGERDVLPTSGLRACTACIVELCYDNEDPQPGKAHHPYRGEVTFITIEDWETERTALLDDLTDGEGRMILHPSEESSSYKSWCKLFAVYGETYTKSSEWTGEFGPGGRKVYKGPFRSVMMRKLDNSNELTRSCGTTLKISAETAHDFRRKVERFTDSSDSASAGAYWPLVQQVRLWSKKWKSLSAGTVLVDAPGLNDNNAARDAVVKQRLRSSDAIWICSNITRAVNDKTAKDLLGSQFRRQVIMDGQVGSLVFVATQTDSISALEVRRQLKLEPNASVPECAKQRNLYAKEQIGKHFYAGLREVSKQSNSKDDLSDDALRARYGVLPVFTVSAKDYQKLTGLDKNDGGAKVWSRLDQTEVPQIRALAAQLTLRRRREIVRQAVEGVQRLCEGLLATAHALTASAEKEELRAAFDQASAEVKPKLLAAAESFGKYFEKALKDTIEPQLQAGAGQAGQLAAQTAAGWGSMHWATYKATVRRNGVFSINMNAELAEPVLRAVATHWQQLFTTDLSNKLKAAQEQTATLVRGFEGRFQKAFAQRIGEGAKKDGSNKKAGGAAVPAKIAANGGSGSGDVRPGVGTSTALVVVTGEVDNVPDDDGGLGGVPAGPNVSNLLAAVNTRLRAFSDKLKTDAQNQQQLISRAIEPAVQEAMKPGYDAGAAEAGTGSSLRRRAIIEGHVRKVGGNTFSQSARGLVDKLGELQRDLLGQLREGACEQVLQDLHMHYCCMWDELTPAGVKSRTQLQAPVAACSLEANNAMRVLQRVSGKKADGGGGGDDELGGDGDELVDVTEQMAAKRAKQRKEDMIDLDSDAWANAQAPPGEAEGGSGGGSGSARVKPEKK